MPATRTMPPGNRLLQGLPRRDRERLDSGCENVDLVFGATLCEPGQRFAHVHFPLCGSISLLATLGDRRALQTGLVGSEGMLGATLSLGVDTAPTRAVVQGAGRALRMPRALFQRELAASAALRGMLARYLYLVLSQRGASVACTHFHAIAPRLARWLLMTQDRAHAARFHITHDFLARMLGVRRSSISVTAAALQRSNVIGYSRGEITILDRPALEHLACPCYAAERAEYARLFG